MLPLLAPHGLSRAPSRRFNLPLAVRPNKLIGKSILPVSWQTCDKRMTGMLCPHCRTALKPVGTALEDGQAGAGAPARRKAMRRRTWRQRIPIESGRQECMFCGAWRSRFVIKARLECSARTRRCDGNVAARIAVDAGLSLAA